LGARAAIVGKWQGDEAFPKNRALDAGERKDTTILLQIDQVMAVDLFQQGPPLIKVIELAVIATSDDSVPSLCF